MGGGKKPSPLKAPVKKGVAKAPVVMQLEALECGAAALTMILAYYGKWVPLEQVRKDCGVSRDGSNAYSILQAAQNYGLKVRAVRAEPQELRDDGTFPCIIHWNFNHFVVLCGFRGNKAYLNDPAQGSRTVSMEVFDQSFTGVCLMFEPGEGFAPGGKPRSVLRFARERLHGAGTAAAFTLLITVISALIGMIDPAFSRVFLDRLLTGQNPDWLYPFLILLSALTFVRLLIAFIQSSVSLRLQGKMEIAGSSSFLWRVLRLPMEFFSQRMAGDIQQRQAANAGIAGTLVNTLAPLVLQAVMMLFYLTVMIRYSPLLAMVGVASVLVNLGMSRLISKKRINITRVQTRDAGLLAGATTAGVEMIETIKASGAENGYFGRWAGLQAGVNAQKMKFARLNQCLGLIPGLVNSLTGIVVLTLGVWLILAGQFTVGMALAFQGFLNSFSGPAGALISAGQTLQEMRTQMERVEDVMRYPLDPICQREEAEKPDETYAKLTGALEMRHVTFGYSRLAPL